MNRPTYLTDEYIINEARDDIEVAGGHSGDPIEGDAKVSADFDNFDLSVDADEADGTIVFCVSGSVDVHYSFREYVQQGSSDEYKLKEWEESCREDYEIYYHIADGQLTKGEPS